MILIGILSDELYFVKLSWIGHHMGSVFTSRVYHHISCLLITASIHVRATTGTIVFRCGGRQLVGLVWLGCPLENARYFRQSNWLILVWSIDTQLLGYQLGFVLRVILQEEILRHFWSTTWLRSQGEYVILSSITVCHRRIYDNLTCDNGWVLLVAVLLPTDHHFMLVTLI